MILIYVAQDMVQWRVLLARYWTFWFRKMQENLWATDPLLAS
jgi:hypothetical protein